MSDRLLLARRAGLLVLLALVLAIVLAGCTEKEDTDLKDSDWSLVKPDKLIILQNVDGHPNIGIVCYASTAWVTTTRVEKAIAPEPRLDAWCAQFDPNAPK